ncbi:MAG: SDR family NAD(P)-dependent oxidoreductase [Pseudomonadota bacterium]
MFSLTDKTCLVTGASSGLGAHFARVLSDSGARVVLAARRLERLESLAEEIRANGRDALPVVMDVTDPASVDAAFEAAEAEFGPIHVLVNNSGVSREGFFTDMSEADWRFVMDANLDGVWRVAKRAANGMKAAETVGSIINISSITAI